MGKWLKRTGIVLLNLILIGVILGLLIAVCLPAIHENRQSMPEWVRKWLADE